jgi:peptide/nickel transport system substrate-binding protein
VQFNLADSNAYWPGTVTGQLGMVASPAWIAAALEDPTLNQAPVGTGPFVFESRAQDSSTKFVRNDAWWGGEVFLDGIEFRHVPDPDTRNTLLFNGEVDGLHTTDPASVGDLQDEEDLQNILDENGEESFAMINSENPPFDDIRARQALTFATPRQNYLDLIGLGIVREANQGFVPESKYYNPDVVQEGDDPEAALALVEAYCAEKGTETNPTLDVPTCTDGKINMELQWSGPSVVQSRIGDLLDEGWSNAGFNVTFDEKPQDEHILEAAIGLYNVVTWRQFGATDPSLDNVWLMCRNIGGISLNWPRKCDESRDTLLLEAMATTDSATREGLYQELQQKIHDDYVYIFFNHTPWDTAVASNVHGMCDRTTAEGTDVQCVSNGRLWFSTIWMDA